MKKSLALRLLRDVIAALVVGLFMFPLFWWGLTSFKPTSAIFNKDEVVFFDFEPTLVNYQVVLMGKSRAELAIESGSTFGVGGTSSYDSRQTIIDSLIVAIGSTILTVFAGVTAAYALSRYRLPGAETVRTIVSLPIIVPGIIVGLALLRYLVVPFGFNITLALFFAHAALVLPYAVRVVSASLDNLRADIEEAAVLLGSSRLGAFFRVVMPNIRGGILAAFILGFVTSFNQVPVSLFLTGPGTATLPIQMLWYMEFSFDPSIAALSALLAVFSIILVLGAERTLGLSRYV